MLGRHAKRMADSRQPISCAQGQLVGHAQKPPSTSHAARYEAVEALTTGKRSGEAGQLRVWLMVWMGRLRLAWVHGR